MEERISGFRVRGTWARVVEHGERLTKALRESLADQGEDEEYTEAFDEWDDWRPKSHERTADVSQKTADQASVEEGKGEQAGKRPDEDLQTAGEKLTESYEKLGEEDPDEAVERWHDSIDYVARAADSAGRKALRTVEDTVYRRVMTQLAPYYFDNALVSANLQRAAGEDDEFVFEVNVNDDDLKDEVSERLAEYEVEFDRWHVDTEKVTETIEAAEGVEPPNGTNDRDSEPDTT